MERIDSEITRLVEHSEFVNRDQAIEELLSTGITAYDTPTDRPAEVSDDLFTQAVDDQQDPALRNDLEDHDTGF